jgi:protein SCO1/2
MSGPPRKVEWAVWTGLAIIVFIIFVAFLARMLRVQPMPIYGTLSDFTLTNQNGRAVTLADLRGQVWIADAIFTRCPGQCLLMTAHMRQIEDILPAAPVQLVSFTTDPAFDTPEVLKKYGDRFGFRENHWSFLTGAKDTLHSVEVDGLKLPVLDKPASEQESSNDLFIHSEKFVLIDKQGRIRGYYDGQEEGAVRQVATAAVTLATSE